MTPLYSIGIDVGKAKLDIGTPSKYLGQFDNTIAGHKKIITKLKTLGGISNICIESTGSYSRLIIESLYEAGFPVSMVQPSRVRHFAKSLGQYAKTDKIDSQLIALFGEKNTLRPYIPPHEGAQELRALVDRRDQIIEDRIREGNRLEACANKNIGKRIKKHVDSLKKEELRLDAEIRAAIKKDGQLNRIDCKLRTIKGVSYVTSSIIIAYLPELGTMSRSHVCALGGVAPFDNSSGNYKGKKRVMGGRERIRKALYMASLSGVRFNPALNKLHLRLLKRGKLRKVSLVACSRKLLIHMNSLITELKGTATQAVA